MEYQFRNAAFGGFNRQDVMGYLEQTAKEQNEQVRLLEEKLAEMEQLQRDFATLQGEFDALQQTNAATAQRAEELSAQLKCAESEAETLRSANQELQAKVFALTPDAEHYRSLRDRMAVMELEAHQRAEKIVGTAKLEAKNLRDDSQQWVIEMKNQFGRLRTEMATSMETAATEMKSAYKLVNTLTQGMQERDRELETLITDWNKKASK